MNAMEQLAEFMPHGMCLDWRPGLMALHIISDAMIAAAYFAIPFCLFYFMKKRTDLERTHRLLAIFFAAFIMLCGLTHVASIVVLWHPVYIWEGWLKALTALVSITTAAVLPLLIPPLLAIPSPKQLQLEVQAHKSTLADLSVAREALAQRIDLAESELRRSNRRFEAALKGSSVTVFEQDQDLRYTWVYNSGLSSPAEALLGSSDTDVFSAESAAATQALKTLALNTGEPQQGECFVVGSERSRWFDMRVEPIRLANGGRGIVGTATDVTARHDHENHLRLLTREMNHRAKNVLAMVTAIARQTARGTGAPVEFEERLSERLASLASAHDVLTRQEWRGADLKAVLEGQLRHYLDTYGARIETEGDDLDLPSEAAHYVGLALHELASNAVKYGALSSEVGTVAVIWRTEVVDGERSLRLDWRETGGPEITQDIPANRGFGSTILKSLAPRAMHGRSEMVFRRHGLEWSLQAPLPAAA